MTPAPKVPCSICWGKGKWPAISDRNWFGQGATRTPDYIQHCGYCRGTGEVKSGRPFAREHSSPRPTDDASPGGPEPLLNTEADLKEIQS